MVVFDFDAPVSDLTILTDKANLPSKCLTVRRDLPGEPAGCGSLIKLRPNEIKRYASSRRDNSSWACTIRKESLVVNRSELRAVILAWGVGSDSEGSW